MFKWLSWQVPKKTVVGSLRYEGYNSGVANLSYSGRVAEKSFSD